MRLMDLKTVSFTLMTDKPAQTISIASLELYETTGRLVPVVLDNVVVTGRSRCELDVTATVRDGVSVDMDAVCALSSLELSVTGAAPVRVAGLVICATAPSDGRLHRKRFMRPAATDVVLFES